MGMCSLVIRLVCFKGFTNEFIIYMSFVAQAAMIDGSDPAAMPRLAKKWRNALHSLYPPSPLTPPNASRRMFSKSDYMHCHAAVHIELEHWQYWEKCAEKFVFFSKKFRFFSQHDNFVKVSFQKKSSIQCKKIQNFLYTFFRCIDFCYDIRV